MCLKECWNIKLHKYVYLKIYLDWLSVFCFVFHQLALSARTYYWIILYVWEFFYSKTTLLHDCFKLTYLWFKLFIFMFYNVFFSEKTLNLTSQIIPNVWFRGDSDGKGLLFRYSKKYLGSCAIWNQHTCIGDSGIDQRSPF